MFYSRLNVVIRPWRGQVREIWGTQRTKQNISEHLKIVLNTQSTHYIWEIPWTLRKRWYQHWKHMILAICQHYSSQHWLERGQDHEPKDCVDSLRKKRPYTSNTRDQPSREAGFMKASMWTFEFGLFLACRLCINYIMTIIQLSYMLSFTSDLITHSDLYTYFPSMSGT